jgi:hypothetical protein
MANAADARELLKQAALLEDQGDEVAACSLYIKAFKMDPSLGL